MYCIAFLPLRGTVLIISAFINTVELEESNPTNEGRYELLVTNLKAAGLCCHFCFCSLHCGYYWSFLEQNMRNKILNATLNSTKESDAKSLFFKSISFPGQTVCK